MENGTDLFIFCGHRGSTRIAERVFRLSLVCVCVFGSSLYCVEVLKNRTEKTLTGPQKGREMGSCLWQGKREKPMCWNRFRCGAQWYAGGKNVRNN